MALGKTWLIFTRQLHTKQYGIVKPLRYLSGASSNCSSIHQPFHVPLIQKSDVQRETTPDISKHFSQLNVNTNRFNLMEKTSEVYKCPLKKNPHKEILDIRNTVGLYDCPDSTKLDVDFILPTMQFFNNLDINLDCPGKSKPEILAKRKVRHTRRILQIRIRKVRRHRLLKIRKRLSFLFKKIKFARKKKKEEKTLAEIAEIYASAENYNPLNMIKEDIAKARKGGFRMDVFGTQMPEK